MRSASSGAGFSNSGLCRKAKRRRRRSGKYKLAVLIAKYGRNEKMFSWSDELTSDYPRKRAPSESDPCGAICQDLLKVV